MHLGVFYGIRNEENYYVDCLRCGISIFHDLFQVVSKYLS